MAIRDDESAWRQRFETPAGADREDPRYQVIHLAAEHYAYGWTAEELLRQHPDLRPEEVYAALTYFDDHHDAMVAEMKDSSTAAVIDRPPQTFTRDERLGRQTAQQTE